MHKDWQNWNALIISVLGSVFFVIIVGFIYISTLPQDLYESVHSPEWETLNVHQMTFSNVEDFHRAEVQLKKRIELDETPIAHFLLGTLYETQGLLPEAMREFDKTIAQVNKTQWNRQLYQHFGENAHAELALANYYIGNYKKAYQELEQANISPYYMSPSLLQALQNTLEDPERGDYHLALGIELRKILQLEHARYEFEQAQRLSLDPVLQSTAVQYLKIKLPQSKQALEPMTRYYMLAGAFYETLYQNPEMAAKHYSQAVLANPKFEWAYSQLGIVSHQSLDYDKAMGNAKQAIAINPKALSPYITMGDVAMDLEDYPNAIEYYAQALSIGQRFLSTEDPELLANIENQLGFAYEQLGQPKKAGNHYQIAYKAAPEYSTDYQYAEQALTRVQ